MVKRACFWWLAWCESDISHLHRDQTQEATAMQETIGEELNGSKSRYEKGLELYKQGKVSINNNGLF